MSKPILIKWVQVYVLLCNVNLTKKILLITLTKCFSQPTSDKVYSKIEYHNYKKSLLLMMTKRMISWYQISKELRLGATIIMKSKKTCYYSLKIIKDLK